MALRSEVVEVSPEGADPVPWREAVHRWRDYIRDSRETAAVFENPEGDQVTGSDPNRFMSGYSDKQYAKTKDLERGIRDHYRQPFVALLSLTASSTDSEGEPLPPVDHLDDLLASWDAVRRALSRRLDGRRWEYLAILEPHKSGYIHVHLAVFVDGYVRPETFGPVIDAHLRNCPRAAPDAHRVEDGEAVSIRKVGSDRTEKVVGNLGTYLAEYLGTYGDGPLEAPEHQQMANAILWATGRQRWRPSQGAQSFMAANRDDSPSEWVFVGIEDGDGEVWPAEQGGGGVTKIETATTDRPPPEPASHRPRTK